MPITVSYNKRDEDGNVMKDAEGNPIKAGFTSFKYQKIFNVQDIQAREGDEEAKQLLEDQILAECDNYTPPSPTELLEEAEKVLGSWKVPTTCNGNKAFYSCT